MKKTYTKKQITEAIAYWEKHLAESKDPSKYKSFDSLKKKLDDELAKMAATRYDDIKKIRDIYDNADDEDDLFEYDLRDVENINFGLRLKLPSGGSLNDKISDFYRDCVFLI